MTAPRKTAKEKTDYEKPEDRHPVTDPPTRKNNETVHTQPCNFNIYFCKKNPPNAQILFPLADEGLKAWGMLAQVPRLDLAAM